MSRGLRAAVLAGLLLVGCDDGAAPPAGQAEIVVSGWVERSSAVALRLTRDGEPVSAAEVTWSVEPAGAATLHGPSGPHEDWTLGLVETGSVTVSADHEDERVSVELDVAAPPDILVDIRVEGNRDIYAVALDGQDLRRLTTAPEDDAQPTSAAGIVVLRRDASTLIRLDLATGQESAISDGGGSAPALDAAGERLALVRGVSGLPRLHVAHAPEWNADPAAQTLGAGPRIDATPSWAADGERLVFMSTASGGADVWLLDAATDEATPLLATEAAEVEPAWSPDGSRVAVVVDEGEGSVIVLVDTNGANLAQVSPPGEVVGQPSWLADGRLLYTTFLDGGTHIQWVDPAEPGVGHSVPLPGSRPEHPAAVRP